VIPDTWTWKAWGSGERHKHIEFNRGNRTQFTALEVSGSVNWTIGEEKHMFEWYITSSQQLYTRYRHSNGLVRVRLNKINQLECEVTGLLDILVGLAWIVDFRSWDLVFCTGILQISHCFSYTLSLALLWLSARDGLFVSLGRDGSD